MKKLLYLILCFSFEMHGSQPEDIKYKRDYDNLNQHCWYLEKDPSRCVVMNYRDQKGQGVVYDVYIGGRHYNAYDNFKDALCVMNNPRYFQMLAAIQRPMFSQN